MPKRTSRLANKAAALKIKKISRKHALSYNRTFVPNGLGVTAISAVNGRGSYAARYAATRKVLESKKEPGMFYYSPVKRAKKKARKKARPNYQSPMAHTVHSSPDTQRRYAALFLKSFEKPAKKAKAAKPAAKKAKKAKSKKIDFVARMAAARKAAAAKRSKRSKRAVPNYRHFRRNEASAAISPLLSDVIVATEKKTSSKAKRAATVAAKKQAASDKKALRVKRMQAGRKRAKAAKRRDARLQRAMRPRVYGGKFKTKREHVKGGFTALTARLGDRAFRSYLYEKKGHARKIPAWALMGSKSPKAFKADEKKKAALAARRKRLAASISKKIEAGRYPFTPNMSFSEWKSVMKKSSKKARKKARRHHRKHAAKKNPLMQAAANRRAARRSRKSRAKMAHAKHSRRRHHRRSRKMLRNPQIATYISNTAGQVADQLVSVVKQGAVISGGLVAHKLLTNLVFNNVDAIKSMKYGKSVAALAVAAVGIPVSAKFIGGKQGLGQQLAVGMGAALVHSVLVDVLEHAGQSKLAAQLGDYTEADKKLPMGSYYEFKPGQSYAGMGGMGSYYEFKPGQSYAGFGDPALMQAAAGVGEYIQQRGAIAGFGDPGLMQAAAGFGSPALMQAAAGVGEYIVQGAEGIGEYEAVRPEYTAPAATRNGIMPSLSAAEQALSVAEAAAGVGGMGEYQDAPEAENFDLSLQQTVYPQGQALDIGDAPGGSRSGVFYGGNGVFGP